jgi:hypothetical protein
MEAGATCSARFSAYGLVFDSEIPALAVEPAPANAPADVRVRRGPVTLPSAAGDSTWLLPAPGVAVADIGHGRLRVESGRRVIADIDTEAPSAFGGMTLLYAAALMLLHQRAAMPLHAAAAVGPEGAALFIGEAAAGKSTFAAMMAAQGFTLASDDLTALDLTRPGGMAVHPAIRTAKLFDDSRAALAERGFDRLLADAGTGYGKAVLDFEGHGGDPAWPAPLRAVFALEWLHPPEAEPELERLSPLAALARLRAAVARPELVGPLGLEAAYFAHLTRLAASVPVFELRRPRRYDAAPAAAALVSRELSAARRDAERSGGSA